MIKISEPNIGEEEKKAVLEVLDSAYLAAGPEVKKFEEEFAKYIGTDYAIATSSGTTALHAALEALDIKGKEIITTPFSFIASSNSILYAGGKPVFADIDEKTYNIDPIKIEKKITDKTKAIMPVHLYGQPAKMDEIIEIAEDHDLKIIEDACQAHGAEYKGRKVGSIGDIGCFSFYPTKNMTSAEGGMITTNDEKLAEKTRRKINHGQTKRYEFTELGYNYRMTDIAAAIGIEQLKKLDEFNERRIANAEYLTKNLKDKVETPFISPNVKHVFHQYTIKTDKRDFLKENLNEAGILTGIYYPIPIHQQQFYRELGYNDSLPVAEKASKEVLSLPVHPRLGDRDMEYIIKTINDII